MIIKGIGVWGIRCTNAVSDCPFLLVSDLFKSKDVRS